eukprot:TRINITY_DN2809_c0_g1_i1.p1 TRINITY_DN2809_c0_g1~~TRINITY_DN2809_c0_g1_i1.p1  ORF type:complete len:327 (-),score=102.48 TRINITY_DN2809_c0_g1_i1:35-1015(-)
MKAAAVLLSLLVCAGGAAVTLVGDAQTGPSREPTSHVFTIDSASPSQMHELKSFEEDSTGVYRSGCLDAAAGVAYLSFAVEDEDGEVTFRIDALDVETGRITKGAHFTMRLYYNMACDSVWHAVVLADVRDEHTAMFYRVDPAAGTVTHLLNYTLADPILQIFNRDAAYDSDTHTMYLLNNNYENCLTHKYSGKMIAANLASKTVATYPWSATQEFDGLAFVPGADYLLGVFFNQFDGSGKNVSSQLARFDFKKGEITGVGDLQWLTANVDGGSTVDSSGKNFYTFAWEMDHSHLLTWNIATGEVSKGGSYSMNTYSFLSAMDERV